MSDPGFSALSATPFDMPPDGNTRAEINAAFDARGGWLINRLVKDLAPLTPIQASGIVGNLGGESGLDPDTNEIAPMVPGSRGGWGWEQATGSRRVDLEKWAAAHGLAAGSDQANYGFLINELLTSEAHSLEQLRKCTTTEAAVYTFEVLFERPSDPQGGLASRVHFAQRALAAATHLPIPPGPTLPPAPQPELPDGDTALMNQIEAERLRRGEPELSPAEMAARLAAMKAARSAPAPVVPTVPAAPIVIAAAPPVIPPGSLPDIVLQRGPWWMVPGIATLVLLIFAGALAASCFMDNDTLRTQMFAIAGAGFTTVLGYLFGSSAGSQKKDDLAAAKAATPQPQPQPTA